VVSAPGEAAPVRVGVLALQGDFEAHAAMLRRAGAKVEEVRVPAGLLGIDALVLPGGESTTMALGIEREGLAGPIRDFCASGRPVFGTCAGMIILGREHLGVLDAAVRRNAFGRQVRSFEQEVDLGLEGGSVHAVFIRAPWVEDWGPGVEVLGEVDGHAIAVRQENVMAVSFHPEISGDERLHRLLVDQAARARVGSSGS
jgi:5'-phosphate synthase pdxT subunit